MNIEERIKKYFTVKPVMQLATTRDGQPWCCTVHFWADEDANLYWISTPERRHSQELRDNPHVAAAIAVQTDEAVPGTLPIGLQVEGTAELIEDEPTVAQVLRQYTARHQRGEKFYQSFMAGNGHKLYRLTPSLYVLFDRQNFPDEPRQEWCPNES